MANPKESTMQNIAMTSDYYFFKNVYHESIKKNSKSYLTSLKLIGTIHLVHHFTPITKEHIVCKKTMKLVQE